MTQPRHPERYDYECNQMFDATRTSSDNHDAALVKAGIVFEDIKEGTTE